MAKWTITIYDRLPVDAAGNIIPIFGAAQGGFKVIADGDVDISEVPGNFARICGDTDCHIKVGSVATTHDPFVPAGMEHVVSLNGGTTISFQTDDTAPAMTSAAAANNAENVALAFALTADETSTFAITGGVDAAHFEISGTTLRWLANGTKDFEIPTDTGANNTYVVQVTPTDLALNVGAAQTITITVTDAGG